MSRFAFSKIRCVAALVILTFDLGICLGCSTLKEAGRKIWGSSIVHLERERVNGQALEFVLSLDECFEKTQKILETHGALIYLKSKDKKYLVAMNFKGHVDTTEVAIFFTKLKDRLTKVEVASMSPRLVEDVADIVFSELK